MRLVTNSFAQPVHGVHRAEWELAKAAHERRDYPSEARLYRFLAERGDARAQNNLGIMYATRR